jgi:hypothetical protein
MYIILKEGRLKNIVSLALRKAGNIRKLEKEIEIPRSTLSGYHTENRKINQENFDKFIIYLNMTIDKKDILKILPDNWRQVKGGKKSVETKKKNGTFEKQLRQCHEGSSSYMRLLHKKMKKENPERYHLIQYSLAY